MRWEFVLACTDVKTRAKCGCNERLLPLDGSIALYCAVRALFLPFLPLSFLCQVPHVVSNTYKGCRVGIL